LLFYSEGEDSLLQQS